MYGIFIYMDLQNWVILKVNVDKYSIHGAYCSMVLVFFYHYLPTKLGDLVRVNVDKYIPAPWWANMGMIKKSDLNRFRLWKSLSATSRRHCWHCQLNFARDFLWQLIPTRSMAIDLSSINHSLRCLCVCVSCWVCPKSQGTP